MLLFDFPALGDGDATVGIFRDHGLLDHLVDPIAGEGEADLIIAGRVVPLNEANV